MMVVKRDKEEAHPPVAPNIKLSGLRWGERVTGTVRHFDILSLLLKSPSNAASHSKTTRICKHTHCLSQYKRASDTRRNEKLALKAIERMGGGHYSYA